MSASKNSTKSVEKIVSDDKQMQCEDKSDMVVVVEDHCNKKGNKYVLHVGSDEI